MLVLVQDNTLLRDIDAVSYRVIPSVVQGQSQLVHGGVTYDSVRTMKLQGANLGHKARALAF